MGCFSFKTRLSKIVLAPDFRVESKKFSIREEVEFINNFFLDCKHQHVKLHLDSNDLRNKRIALNKMNLFEPTQESENQNLEL